MIENKQFSVEEIQNWNTARFNPVSGTEYSFPISMTGILGYETATGLFRNITVDATGALNVNAALDVNSMVSSLSSMQGMTGAISTNVASINTLVSALSSVQSMNGAMSSYLGSLNTAVSALSSMGVTDVNSMVSSLSTISEYTGAISSNTNYLPSLNTMVSSLSSVQSFNGAISSYLASMNTSVSALSAISYSNGVISTYIYSLPAMLSAISAGTYVGGVTSTYLGSLNTMVSSNSAISYSNGVISTGIGSLNTMVSALSAIQGSLGFLSASTGYPVSAWTATDYFTSAATFEVRATPGAGKSLYLTDFLISNGATAGTITVVEATGGAKTPLVGKMYFAVNGGATSNFKTPIKVTANTNLGIDGSSVTTHSVTFNGYII
jgi:hypothetical protein